MSDIYSIDQYLNAFVDINHVSFSGGVKSITSTEYDVPAKVTSNKFEIDRDAVGSHIGSTMGTHRLSTVPFVMLKPDQEIGDEDEIIIDDIVHKNMGIRKVRGQYNQIMYLQVYI